MDTNDVDLNEIFAFADPTPVAPDTEPTAGQVWYAWLRMPGELRRRKIELLLSSMSIAQRCHAQDHPGEIRSLQARLTAHVHPNQRGTW